MDLNWTQVLPLLVGAGLDLVFGDPVYHWHPIRVIGRFITRTEIFLRSWWGGGRWSGVFLVGFSCFYALAIWILGRKILELLSLSGWVWIWESYLVFSLLAYKDLVQSAFRIEKACTQKSDIPSNATQSEHAGKVHLYTSNSDLHLNEAREAARCLAGRDLDQLDAAGLRRIGLESLAESFVDGILSPLFYLAIFGIPGLIIFKTISTLDSMVGYKTERYLHFGWFAARADDLLNYIPARLSYLLLAFCAWILPGYSVKKSLSVGWKQHALVPGPNSGWSEASAAGALSLRLVGPIYKDGKLLTQIWLGNSTDPEGGREGDIRRMVLLISLASGFAFLVTFALLLQNF